MPEYPLVLVEWINAYGCSPSWASVENLDPKPVRAKSAGYLVHQDSDVYVIVPHLIKSNKEGCGDMTIPRAAVKRIATLQEARYGDDPPDSLGLGRSLDVPSGEAVRRPK